MSKGSIYCVPLVASAVHPPLLVWLLVFCLIQYFHGAFIEGVLNACLWTTEKCFQQKSKMHSALSSNQEEETKNLSNVFKTQG